MAENDPNALPPASGQMTVQQALDAAVQYHNAGKFPEAENIYRQILAADPDQPVALNLLGVMAHQVGENEMALDLIGKAITVVPDYAEAHYNLGLTQQALGRTEDAAESYRRALEVQPENPAAHYNLGLALQDMGRSGDAAESYREAIRLKPDYAEAHCNLGRALMGLGNTGEAAECIAKAVEINPDYADAHYNLGFALKDAGRLDEAEHSFRRAIALKPDFVDAHGHLGSVLQDQGKPEEAVACFEQALAIRPGYVKALNNLGNALVELGRFDEAAERFEQAIAAEPGNANAECNYGMLLLLRGDFERGLEKYEYRLSPDFAGAGNVRAFAQPKWDGTGLEGKTILLYAEQGAGDALQFVRYAKAVSEQGGTVVLEAPADIKPLLATAAGIDTIITPEEPLPDFDVHAPLLSLPHLLGTTLGTIPADAPYLSVPEGASVDLPDPGKRNVGLVWAGNPAHKNDRNRSIDVAMLAPLLDAPATRFYALQVGDRAGDMEKAGLGDRITDLSPQLSDYAATAAAIGKLDLVVSVDTSVAHLAGALGKPCFVLLPHVPDFRWMLERDDSPWYPALTLFRQPARGDWPSVIAAVREKLVSGA